MPSRVCAPLDDNSEALPSRELGDLNIKGCFFWMYSARVVSRCSFDPAEGAFCQDFTQPHRCVQAGAARGDRYQRLQFLLPD